MLLNTPLPSSHDRHAPCPSLYHGPPGKYVAENRETIPPWMCSHALCAAPLTCPLSPSPTPSLLVPLMMLKQGTYRSSRSSAGFGEDSLARPDRWTVPKLLEEHIIIRFSGFFLCVLGFGLGDTLLIRRLDLPYYSSCLLPPRPAMASSKVATRRNGNATRTTLAIYREPARGRREDC